MKAIQLVSHGAPGQMEMRTLPEPRPASNEVVVRVRACGLNHLDLWAEQGALPVRIELPRIQGGEIAGEVVSVGGEVRDWQVGDRVAVQSNLFCGMCEFCLRGEESICLKSQLLGVERDGGFAEMVVIPSNALVRLPDGVSFENAAALTLAGSTAMHMLTNRAQVRSGDWVLVIGGASGVGSAAIQIAKRLGAYVISTGSTQEKREFALGLGANFVVDSSYHEWAAEVRKITEKRGVDLVVEHVGGDVLLQAFTCLARNGKVVTCGATAGRDIALKLWPFFVKQHSLIGSYGRNRSDMAAALQWNAEGKLKPAIDRSYPLAETGAAFAALRNRTVKGKVIVQP